MSFLIEKHEKFFNRCLIALPSKLQSEDSNQLALIYFCLHGLGLIKRLKFSLQEEKYYQDYIIENYLLETNEFQGFRTTNYYRNCKNHYDLPNISSTFFALVNLLILNYDYSKVINRHKVIAFLKLCQSQLGENKGSFAPTIRFNQVSEKYEPFGEPDLRICYMALCIMNLINYEDFAGKSLIIEYILSNFTYQGGLSSNNESHLGFTFCGLASLKLLNVDLTTGNQFKSTIDWLIHRQLYYTSLDDMNYPYYQIQDQGSYNGRENKFGDTCYSWWCSASLNLLESLHLTNIQQAKAYLLNTTQNSLMGGFGKDFQSNPDPFHSFLAIASLSLWNNQLQDQSIVLEEIDPVLVITKTSKHWLQKIKNNW